MSDPKAAMLRKCRDTFERYGRNHRAKAQKFAMLAGSDDQVRDTTLKAEANEAMVVEIDAVLKLPDHLAETERAS